MELQLDRKIANKRIFLQSIWHHQVQGDDLLLDQKTLQRMWIMRKYLSDMNPVEVSFINDRFKQTKTMKSFNIDEWLI
jgi:transcription termination factor Rho